MQQPTVEEINAHLKTGLKRVLYYPPGCNFTLRLLEARTQGGVKQGRVMGYEGFREEAQWTDIRPDARIDLLK